VTDLGAGAPTTEVAGRLAACGWGRLHSAAEARGGIVTLREALPLLGRIRTALERDEDAPPNHTAVDGASGRAQD
jgi:hypothetical protein